MLVTESNTFTWVDGLRLMAVPGLVLLNSFFVAAEFALVAVRRTRVEQMLQQGSRRAASLSRQIHTLDHSIAATQLGITIASLLLGWIGEKALAALLMPFFSSLDFGWKLTVVHTISVTFALIIITILHVVAGELAPKAVALQRPDQVGLWVAIPLEIFTRVTRPFVILMNGLGNGLVRLMGVKPAGAGQHVHSVEELGMLIGEVEEAGLISEEQAEYVHNVFLFSAKKIGECMLPREKMICVELHTPLPQILDQVRESAHTRIPVYDGSLDNIVGIVNTKDLLHLVSLQGMAILDDAIYPAIFMKPDQSIADALRHFKRTHRHMAIVRNTANEVVGLITLEDILEEIIGDIEDEHDQPKTQRRFRLSRAVWKIGKTPPAIGKSGLSQNPPPRPAPPNPG